MVEVIVLFAFAASVVLTGLLRAYALRRSLLDVPNERSSHVTTTPRGGGLAIVLVVLAVTGWLQQHQLLPPGLAQVLFGGGAAVALIGWIDDHRSLGAAVRAGTHLLAAAWAVYVFGGVAEIDLGFARPTLGVTFGSALAVIAIAWLINVYNFLDGTDGYAGTQAVCAALAGVLLFHLAGQVGLAMLCATVVAASAGFLVWNWSPAKIFMGDVGSYFLGYVFGVLALFGEKSASVPAMVWVMLLGVFIWDATLTLARRVLSGERWYEAHRSHAYQRLHQMGFSHRRIAFLLLAVNGLWIWPLTWAATVRPGFLLTASVSSAVVLAGLWFAIQRRFAERAR
jgi:Fuc2NAc and GlcNAc transferase